MSSSKANLTTLIESQSATIREQAKELAELKQEVASLKTTAPKKNDIQRSNKAPAEKRTTMDKNEQQHSNNQIITNSSPSETHTSNKDNDSNWIYVAKKLNKNENNWANPSNKSKNKTAMTGQNKEETNLARPKRYHLYTGNWRSDVEPEEVKKRLCKFLNILEFEELKSTKLFDKNYERSKSFHVTIDEVSLNESRNPNNWPHGIIVKRFFFYDKSKSKNELNRNEEKQTNLPEGNQNLANSNNE